MLKKFLKVALMVALMVGVCYAGEALAASNVFGTARDKLFTVFKNVRSIVFILGAFALVGFAVAAIFGKLAWQKVAILAVGLAILAVAGMVVSYVVKPSNVSGFSTDNQLNTANDF